MSAARAVAGACVGWGCDPRVWARARRRRRVRLAPRPGGGLDKRRGPRKRQGRSRRAGAAYIVGIRREDHRAPGPRHPLPHLPREGRLRRAQPRRLLGGLRSARDGRAARRLRPHVHERPRHRDRRRRREGARAPRGGPRARGDHGRLPRLLPPAHPGPAAALDRTREGHRAHDDGRGPERDLGSVGSPRGQARLEAARGPDAAADGGLRSLQLDHRRADARRGARDPGAESRDSRGARGRDATRRLSGLHHLDRLARLPRREGEAPVPRGDRAGLHALQDEGVGGP